jgi:hypothetical protein
VWATNSGPLKVSVEPAKEVFSWRWSFMALSGISLAIRCEFSTIIFWACKFVEFNRPRDLLSRLGAGRDGNGN